MIIGCPKEIKTLENRVGIIPASIQALVTAGHEVLIEENAGLGSGISNEDYLNSGAQIITSADDLWAAADMIVKVKEPLEPEYNRMREGQTLFTYLHLAAEETLTKVMLEKKVNGVAFETVENNGLLPLLKPMSEVAGKMATQVGAFSLEKKNGGKGILLGGVPGVERAKVVIIGGGIVGTNAAKIAVGMGAFVTIIDRDLHRLEYLTDLFGTDIQTLYAAERHITESIQTADLLIGAVLVKGAKAPTLVSREQVAQMEEGSVIVDVAVDQGGCIETSRVTTHNKPTFIEEGVVHYGVANMPGAVARTSTFALSHAVFPYLLKLANLGLKDAILNDSALALGLNTFAGKLTYKAVAEAHNMEYTPLSSLGF